MALSDNALKNNLLSLFNEMEGAPMGKEVFAEKLAKVMDDQIKTAGVPAGSVLIGATGGVSNPAPINVE